MARTGRPSLITKVGAQIIDLCQRGASPHAAAGAVGISRQSLHQYRVRGRRLSEQQAEGQLPTPTTDQVALIEFYAALGAPEPDNGRTRSCQRCGRPFVTRYGSRYCTDRCKRAYQSARYLTLYYLAIQTGHVRVGMVHHRALVTYLAERDGSACGICGAPVDITLKSGTRGDQQGPSLDHVVPRSQGGQDELANLRLTHWACNRQRGNRGGNEQLQMVG